MSIWKKLFGGGESTSQSETPTSREDPEQKQGSEQRFCTRFKKKITLSNQNGYLVCESSLPIKTNKEVCSQNCVHKIIVQIAFAELRKVKQLTDADLQKATGYKDWAPQ